MRKVILGLLVLLALAAPIAFTAPVLAAKPVKLKLLRIVCNTGQQGEIGGDEIFIELNGVRVFGPADIAEEEELDLTGIGKRTFRDQIEVSLFEDDAGAGDEFLGSAAISRNLVGQGEQSVTFTGEGSEYLLFFKVTKR